MTNHDPKDIMRIAFGFFGAQALLTAARLELFSTLGDDGLAAEAICDALGLQPRPARDLLDALVALKLLEREGDGPNAIYRNTADGRAYLDRRSPLYIGGILVMAQQRLYRNWADLDIALRTRPQDGGDAVFPRMYADPNTLSQFVGGMEGGQRLTFLNFAERYDFSRHASLCDVGGASGELCIAVANAHPHLACTTFDLPAVAASANKRIGEAGLAGRIAVVSGDFFRDPLPRADVITMSTVLHDWGLEKKLLLIKKAYDALPEGGVFIAIEYLIDDARRKNAFGLLMSLNMLLEFGDGFDYTGAEFSAWCRSVGFRDTQTLRLNGGMSAAIALK